MRSLIRLSPIVVLVAPAVALAGEKEEAEHTRLSEEMSRLASRNAWRGVENSYQKMLALERKGVVLTYTDHFLAAQAASALGDVTVTHARASRARDATSDAGERQEAEAWVGQIESSYGPVALKVPPKYAESVSFEIATMPFNPEHRAVYQAAQARLLAGESYEGLLPLGSYSFGTETFDISANSDFNAPLRVAFDPGGSVQADTLIAYVGPRLDLGGALSSAGDPASTNEPAGFWGAGLRAGLGAEVGLRGGVGVLVEVGYHSLASAEEGDLAGVVVTDTGLTAGEALGVVNSDTALRAGYSWLAATWRPVPAVSIAAGPVYSIGSGSAQGTGDGLASYDSYNAEIRAGGVSGGLTWITPAAVGPVAVGVSALGGAQSDTSRWYTWGQLALTITPVGRDG